MDSRLPGSIVFTGDSFFVIVSHFHFVFLFIPFSFHLIFISSHFHFTTQYVPHDMYVHNRDQCRSASFLFLPHFNGVSYHHSSESALFRIHHVSKNPTHWQCRRISKDFSGNSIYNIENPSISFCQINCIQNGKSLIQCIGLEKEKLHLVLK